MATNISSFVPEIAVNILGCPKTIINHYLIDILRDFCERTFVWNQWISQSITAPTETYTLTAPTNSEIVDIIKIEYDSDGSSFDDYYFLSPNLVLSYEPTDDFTLNILVALRPTRSITSVEDFLYKDYSRIIIAGTTAKLASMPGKDWTNPEFSASQFYEYEAGIGRTKALVYDRLMKAEGKRFI